MTEVTWNRIGVSDRKLALIKSWFKLRFNREPEHDRAYFGEWLTRFAFKKDDEYPWQMDKASRDAWTVVRLFSDWVEEPESNNTEIPVWSEEKVERFQRIMKH